MLISSASEDLSKEQAFTGVTMFPGLSSKLRERDYIPWAGIGGKKTEVGERKSHSISRRNTAVYISSRRRSLNDFRKFSFCFELSLEH
ncbi:hypothetical protein K438DRAFT_1886691 [Mycena galopus ATCC 62051]|nr:hypothetical protein K438DRAFT_1886691 [Mycena galopus ATCC 62051]